MKHVHIDLVKDRNVTLDLYCHKPSPELKSVVKRPFILVLPGGGYSFCSDREAEPVALKYIAEGYNAGVLRYSVGEFRNHAHALNDVESSLEYVLQHAQQLGVDESKTAILGFSAGGHLAASVSCLGKVRPNLCMLGYPAITDKFAQLMQIDAPSLDQCVNEYTPNTFLFTTFGDQLVPVENTLLYANALDQKDIPFELHVFQKGGHGMSLGTEAVANGNIQSVNHDFAQWFDLSIRWLRANWGSFEVGVIERNRGISIKEYCADKDNKNLLFATFPMLEDKGWYKILRNFTLEEVNASAPMILDTDKLNDLKQRLK